MSHLLLLESGEPSILKIRHLDNYSHMVSQSKGA